jgi:hypothetical protein
MRHGTRAAELREESPEIALKEFQLPYRLVRNVAHPRKRWLGNTPYAPS